jgi:hypothetical protein
VKPQLFYQISDPGGAAARKAIIAAGLLEAVQFRNLFYEEVRVDLEAHHRATGGSGAPELPALWDGETLHEGTARVLVAIEALALAAGTRTLPTP